MIEVLLLLIGISTGVYGIINFMDGVIDNDGVYTIEFLLGLLLPCISIICFIQIYSTLGLIDTLMGVIIIPILVYILGMI